MGTTGEKGRLSPLLLLRRGGGLSPILFLGNSKASRIKEALMVLATTLTYPQLSIYKGHFFHSKHIFP